MEKKYIKLNNCDNNLSLGNFCRVVKENSINKIYANQANIFATIMNIDSVNESTINNYCIGCRSIGNNYKELYFDYRDKYKKDKLFMLDIILTLISIIDGYVYTDEYKQIKFVNNNKNLIKVVNKLYNIAKNDKSITNKFINSLNKFISNKKYYECIVEILFYIILEKKQPIYVGSIVNDTIENILNNTNISIVDLENFLNLQFRDGVNYIYSLKKLAKENNAYACFELGLMEYKGEIAGKSRYNKAFEYFKIAADYNHPRANYLIGKMLLNKNIGELSNRDITLSFKYLKKAESSMNIASLNALGLYYLNIKNDIDTAVKYFKRGIKYNYVYSFNNLGLLEEKKGNYKNAFEYYLKSADLNESWACNKIGEYYRLGKCGEVDMKKAFYYYNRAIEVPVYLINPYAKYNLAKYFYLNGNYEAEIEKNEVLAIGFLEEIEDKLIDGCMELFYYYLKKYDYDKVYYYKKKIEKHPKYCKKIKEEIEKEIVIIKEKEEINI